MKTEDLTILVPAGHGVGTHSNLIVNTVPIPKALKVTPAVKETMSIYEKELGKTKAEVDELRKTIGDSIEHAKKANLFDEMLRDIMNKKALSRDKLMEKYSKYI